MTSPETVPSAAPEPTPPPGGVSPDPAQAALAAAGPLEGLLVRLLEDLEVLASRRLRAHTALLQRGSQRAEGLGRIALAFRFALDRLTDSYAACLVLAWPDAALLAGAFDLVPEAQLGGLRQAAGPDADAKRRLLELGPFLAGSLEAGLAEIGCGGLLVRFETCQGLRGDQRPGLGASDPDWVGLRLELAFEGFDPGPALLLFEQVALA